MSAQRRPPADAPLRLDDTLQRDGQLAALAGSPAPRPEWQSRKHSSKTSTEAGGRLRVAKLGGVTASAMRALGYKDKRSDLFGSNVIVSCGLFAAALSIQNVHVSDGINDQHHVET